MASLKAALNFVKYNIQPGFKKGLKKAIKAGKQKRFFKNPLVNFGLSAVVLLVLIVALSPKLIKPSSKEDFSFLSANASLSISSSQNLFAESAKNIYRETPEIAFLQENSLVGVVPPVVLTGKTLGAIVCDGADFEPENRNAIVEYEVEPGDTLSAVATKFNVSSDSILWANELSKGSKIKQGQILVIPPVSGIIYHVKKGDTLGAIANTYKGKTEEMIAFNELAGENDIFIGDIIIIPNGQMPQKPKVQPSAPSQIPIASSYFICPTSGCKITQGLHFYNAIDFDGECGDPVLASAGGVVQKIKYGWNSGAGNYLTVLHPNGVVTNYGHISSSLVNPGQEVSQGKIIALMGGKPGTPGAGRSTGCHVHFGVTGARNPFAR